MKAQLAQRLAQRAQTEAHGQTFLVCLFLMPNFATQKLMQGESPDLLLLSKNNLKTNKMKPIVLRKTKEGRV